MVKKLTNLLRNKNPVTARQFVGFLRKTSDQREPTILSDKVVSLLPQLTFEDERTRAKERYEQQAKELKKDSRQGSNAAAKKPAVPKRKESAEEREYKARELLIKEDEDERRKFTIILASLGKMRKIEGMLYVYNMLKSRERQEDERIRQALDEAASRKEKAPVMEDSRWKVDVYMYNLVLDALAKAGYLGKMEEILQDMAQSRVDKDRVTYSVLYGAYSSRGDDTRADQVWQEMKDRGVEMDLAGYNGLMNTFARRDDVDRVLETYKQMQTAGIQPDQGTFSILLECCARDALEFRTRTSAAAAAATETEKAGDEEGEAVKTGEEEDDDGLYAMDEKERVRILQSKRRRMEAVMRAMKKAKVRLDNILVNSIIRCYASLGEVEEMFSVVRFLVEEENIKLAEDNYSLMVYCAGREKAIDVGRLTKVLEEMKWSNVQPTAKTINAAIHSFAFAGPQQLEAFILPPSAPTTNEAGAAAGDDGKNESEAEKAKKRKADGAKEKKEEQQVSLWQLIKKYGVVVTDDILFDLLKVYATNEAAPVAPAGADVVGIVEGARRQLDRARLAKLLHKMKEEGFGSSLTVFNSLMRFHAAYGENRVREVTVLYSQMKKRQVRPNLQTYLVMVDTILSTERKVQPEQRPASSGKASGEEKEREKERAELSYLLFSEMQSEGVQPNLKLFNSLIELSGFEELRRRASVVDSTTHNVDGDRSAALGEEEFRQKVLSILTEMRRLGIRPNTKTLKCISSACAVAGAGEALGPAIFDELPRLFA